MIYEYKCSMCGHEREVEISMKNKIPSELECPWCNSNMKRVWNNAGFIGCKGFYSVDNRKK